MGYNKNFVILEECESDTLVTPIKAKDKEQARDKYNSFEGGVFIVMAESELNNLCIRMVGG